ncbi:uncharacterized protein DUF4440 [Paraburkholderia sp. BL23I1N1]|uniref:nuclear transport factor 2 family protein n=1 Tax=Paraburkholderia sp. BL23I1N1 TaxID=1938802 RepID=UPI000FF3ADED|nr:nuclear transport factor 2 family protein [Paraburkholderia sp. BL23I1N1]RKE36345.1 uncharacterized protein DUF4440 [Paraburkholderia sp. BL23I1N1]
MTALSRTDLETLANKLERQHWAATLENDSTALTPLLSDEFVFVHSSGVVDNKASYLNKFGKGVFAYHSVQRRIERVTSSGDDAFTTYGYGDIDATVAGVRKQIRCVLSTAWRREGGVWRLLAHHTILSPETW